MTLSMGSRHATVWPILQAEDLTEMEILAELTKDELRCVVNVFWYAY